MEYEGKDTTWYLPVEYNWAPLKLSKPEDTSCKSFEVYSYGEGTEKVILEEEVDGKSLPAWMEKDLSSHCPGDGKRKPVSGLRLLIAKHLWSEQRLSVDKDSYDRIADAFDLQEMFLNMMNSDTAHAMPYYTHRSKEGSLPGLFMKYSCTHPLFFALCLHYEPGTNMTTGFVVLRSSFLSYFQLPDLLRHQATYHASPLVLPLVLSECLLLFISKRGYNHTVELANLAESTGQQSFASTNPEDETLEGLDLVKVTKTLNRQGHYNAKDTQNLGFVLDGIEKFAAWGEAIAAGRGGGGKVGGGKEGSWREREGERMVEDKITYLMEFGRGTLGQYEFGKTQIGILIQVYQVQSQRDSHINISLAETSATIAKASKADTEVMKVIAIETKRDSTAMKTIAILGMIFLPGTFIAAIFAMPVLDWSPPNSSSTVVLRKGFGIYWALTIPLTLLVLMTWGASILLPWRKWLAASPLKRRILGPDVAVVDLELEGGDEVDRKGDEESWKCKVEVKEIGKEGEEGKKGA